MKVALVLLLFLVLAGGALLATGRAGGLVPAPPDERPDSLPPGPLDAADLLAVRLPVAVRGYRMAAVDALLDRLGGDLAERDGEVRRLADELARREAEVAELDAELARRPLPGEEANHG